MRKLRLKMFVSTDGFVGGSDGCVDWLFRSLDEAAVSWMTERLWEAGLHIMGSSTFRGTKAFYPQSAEPYAPPMKAIPKAYFSRGGANGALAAKSFDDAKRPSPRGAPEIAVHALSRELKTLTQMGVVRRIDHKQVPPKVEYELTPDGASLIPMIKVIHDWSVKHFNGDAPAPQT